MTVRDVAWVLVLLALWPVVWFGAFGIGAPVWVEVALLATAPVAVGLAARRRWAGCVVLASIVLVVPVALATGGVYGPDSGDTSLGEGLLFVAFSYGLPAAALVQLGAMSGVMIGRARLRRTTQAGR